MTRVVNVKHGYTDGVYIGRGSMYGNPFVIGKDGTRADVVRMYEEWMREELESGGILAEDILALDGETLKCFCKPLACHGDVLVKLIGELKCG